MKLPRRRITVKENDTRVLNYDENQFTLEAGRYEIESDGKKIKITKLPDRKMRKAK